MLATRNRFNKAIPELSPAPTSKGETTMDLSDLLSEIHYKIYAYLDDLSFPSICAAITHASRRVHGLAACAHGEKLARFVRTLMTRQNTEILLFGPY